MKTLLLVLTALAMISCFFITCNSTQDSYIILLSDQATTMEKLAAKELRRYVYVRTDHLSPIHVWPNLPPRAQNIILVAQKDNLPQTLLPDSLVSVAQNLAPQQFQLQTINTSKQSITAIIGGDAQGALFGCYRLIEKMGVQFFLDGDVIPDQKIALQIPSCNEIGKPLFETRGIQPFHDFPEGPDWWNLDDYKAIIAQLPKMGMNFIGFHTYPQGGVGPEPLVWIGLPEDIRPDGTASFSYPARHFTTQSGTWGYKPTLTFDYHLGASRLFESDVYGADYMTGMTPWPATQEDCNILFQRMGLFLREAFLFAHDLGIKTCVGTETPLIIPSAVQQRLESLGLDPDSPATIQKIYQGMFSWIAQNYPLDYYWLWTPEGWTWEAVEKAQVAETERDMLLAVQAAKQVNAPFTLATCGWVLGPPQDRAQFDRVLPKEMPFSCINRMVGYSPVEPGFARVSGRPKWAIPWLEDDPALTSPQLWVGRMRKDARDALKYGCTGLLGIHWRTRILGANVSALAKAGWEQQEWRDDIPAETDSSRHLATLDFYTAWAAAQFGPDVAEPIAKLFARLDGEPLEKPVKGYNANLFRGSEWRGGPGAVIRNKMPWSKVSEYYEFIEEFESYRDRIKGPGHQECFDYWRDTFLYAKTMAQLGCTLGALDSLMVQIDQEKQNTVKQELVVNQAIPQRKAAARLYSDMMTYLLQTVSTSGEMGSVANLEQHNLGQLQMLTRHDSVLTYLSGQPLPPECDPDSSYRGIDRLIVPTKRSILEKDEDLNLKVILLSSSAPAEMRCYYRPMGSGSYQFAPLENVARNVYRVTIPHDSIQDQDFEYYIQVDMASGKKYFPATAPKINQTVVVLDEN